MIDEVLLLDQRKCRADDEPYANSATKEDGIVDFNEYSAELLVATRRDSDDTLNALEASRERLLAAARAGRLGKVALARATAARMIAAWTRSEERRVGKEGRARRSAADGKNK